MIEDVKTHLWHYAILMLMIFSGGVVFFFSPNKMIKFQLGVLVATAYVVWGMTHHFLEKNLNPKIVIEYILIGFLAVILLGGALL